MDSLVALQALCQADKALLFQVIAVERLVKTSDMPYLGGVK
jgi:hypothetical protein